jgi:hypothetical protein
MVSMKQGGPRLRGTRLVNHSEGRGSSDRWSAGKTISIGVPVKAEARGWLRMARCWHRNRDRCPRTAQAGTAGPERRLGGCTAPHTPSTQSNSTKM